MRWCNVDHIGIRAQRRLCGSRTHTGGQVNEPMSRTILNAEIDNVFSVDGTVDALRRTRCSRTAVCHIQATWIHPTRRVVDAVARDGTLATREARACAADGR